MKKVLLTLLCLTAMMAAGTSLKAQEATIVLNPGWNWISCPMMDTLNFETALGSFTPTAGDIIKSRWGQAIYTNGHWMGSISQFFPGYGYHYKSNRTMPVLVTFNAQQPAPQVVVTTSEPTDITTNSATCGGNVTSSSGDYVFVFSRGICWGTSPNPAFNDNYIEAGNGLGNFNVSMTELTPGTTYYVRAFAVTPMGTSYGEELSFITLDSGGVIGGHEYVDLGLPSGLLWATCNVGANAPEDYGNYYAWGETAPKSNYSWSTYQYSMGYYNTLTKYCAQSNYGYNGFTDNLTTLLPEDDAATANWGNGWRMPTIEELQELYDNTTVTWTTQNGVNGALFTASNGSSLFMPAAGGRLDGGLYGAGTGGSCYSSSLATDASYAAKVFAFSLTGNYISCHTNGYERYIGRTVRAVRSAPQNNAPTGAINGKFTINEDGDQVYFSQGNLQYQASTNTWKFAENQYDYIGSDNSNISSTYSGWIDLFGWGTSGYNHGAVCYQPWSTSQANSDYYAYGDYIYYLDSQTGQADWGYNPISNGGNQENQWRTLTNEEWDYIFTTRSTASDIRYAKAQVNNRNGVILLPDDWISDTYSLNNTNNCSANYNSNTITASQWTTLENSGAVFLPAAGLRNGTSVINVGDNVGGCGYYWSSLCCNTSFCNHYAILLEFDQSSLFTDGSGNRFFGLSVRLVRVVEN